MSAPGHSSGEAADVVVVGAGPAGLAAATLLAREGATTVLVDENPAPGGQIYRGVGQASPKRRRLLGQDYARGAALCDAFLGSGADYRPHTTLWSVAGGFELGVSSGGCADLIHAKTLVLATGAMERPTPIPGWTLPGVMGAGAAQILLKTSGLVADGAILAGSGPLLWLLAQQYRAAGGTIRAILDTTGRAAWRTAASELPVFLTSRYFPKGLSLLGSALGRVPWLRGVTDLHAEGGERLERVAFRHEGREQTLAADLLFLHQGVVPNVNLFDAIGCKLAWDEIQQCWRPETDTWSRSSIDGVWIAGDGAGIAGAEAAAITGRLAGLDVLHRLGRLSQTERDTRGHAIREQLAKATCGRGFLDRLYRPAFERPAPDTLLCRCEEVTASQLATAVQAGCMGPNQAKTFLRCGMGPCQGRLCGTTLTQSIAELRDAAPSDVGGLHLRFPTKPITLGELASMPQTEADERAVVRL